MSESRIASTVAQGYRRLGMSGQPVIAAYGQLFQILRNRLGREHAALLARPNIDPSTGTVEWLSPGSSEARPLSSLPEHERASITALAEQLLREIRQLADKLKREGPSAELVGKMLDEAVQTPPGDWLYEVDGKPLLIMWGHATETAGAPAVPVSGAPGAVPSTSPAPAVAPIAAEESAVVEPVTPIPPPPVVVTERPWWKRWWWLILLLLLLLAALLWWLLHGRDTEDAILGTPRARSAAIDEALAKQRALLAELEALKSRTAPQAQGCMRNDPERTYPPVPDPGPGGKGTPGPDSNTGPTPGPTPGPGDSSTPPPDNPSTTPPPGPDSKPDGTPPGPSGKPPGPSGKPDDTMPDAGKRPDADTKTDPPIPPKPEDELRLPKTQDPKLGFLKGDWKGGSGLTDTSGRPIDLSMSFQDGGKGTVTIRRPGDGAVCTGPIQGAMKNGKLEVEGSGSVACQGGGNFAAPHFECGKDTRGQTVCNGINKDGSRYEMDISKAR